MKPTEPETEGLLPNWRETISASIRDSVTDAVSVAEPATLNVPQAGSIRQAATQSGLRQPDAGRISDFAPRPAATPSLSHLSAGSVPGRGAEDGNDEAEASTRQVAAIEANTRAIREQRQAVPTQAGASGATEARISSQPGQTVQASATAYQMAQIRPQNLTASLALQSSRDQAVRLDRAGDVPGETTALTRPHPSAQVPQSLSQVQASALTPQLAGDVAGSPSLRSSESSSSATVTLERIAERLERASVERSDTREVATVSQALATNQQARTAGPAEQVRLPASVGLATVGNVAAMERAGQPSPSLGSMRPQADNAPSITLERISDTIQRSASNTTAGERLSGAAGAGNAGTVATSLTVALGDNTRATQANTAATARGVPGRGMSRSQTGLPAGTGEAGSVKLPDPGKLDQWSDSLKQFSATANSAFSGATSGIMGFVSAISPSAVNTLSGSFKMLSQEVGQVFEPYIWAAARGVREAAGLFGGLDDGLKTTIGRVAVAGTALLGFTAITSGTITGVKSLAGSFAQLGRVVSFGFATNPAIAATLGLATAVSTLIATYWGLSRASDAAGLSMRQMERVGAQAGDSIQRLQAINPQVDFAPLPADVRQQLELAKTATETQRIIREHEESLTKQRSQLLGSQPQEVNRVRDQYAAVVKLAEPEVLRLDTLWLQAVEKFTVANNGIDPRKDEQRYASKFLGSPQYAQYGDEFDAATVRLRKQAAASGLPRDLISRVMLPGGFLERPTLNRPTTPTTAPGFDANLSRIDAALRVTGNLLSRLGAGQGESRVGKVSDLENIKFPGQAKILDAVSYRDSVQLAALNNGSLDAVNAQREVLALLKHLGVLDTMLTEMQGLRQAQADLGRYFQNQQNYAPMPGVK